MDLTESLDAACTPEHLFSLVEDLSGYPAWLSIVPFAAAEASAAADDPADGDEGPAWQVELQGRLGPLSRSKRLRMVRTVHEHPRHVRFERHERDGRTHSPWILDATIEATDQGARVTMHLHYGGGLGAVVLEGVLREEIHRSRPRLRALAEQGLPTPDGS